MFRVAPTELHPRDCARPYRHFAPTELKMCEALPLSNTIGSVKVVGYPRAEIPAPLAPA